MNSIKHPTQKQVAYIQRNLNRIPFHVMRQNLRVSTGVMYEWVKNLYQPEKQIIVDDDGVELHNHYLVTIDNFNYIVTFNTPVDFNSIQYCKHRIGFDYTVSKLGHWEYSHLRNNIPCINLKSDSNYIAHFWATTKLWHE